MSATGSTALSPWRPTTTRCSSWALLLCAFVVAVPLPALPGWAVPVAMMVLVGATAAVVRGGTPIARGAAAVLALVFGLALLARLTGWTLLGSWPLPVLFALAVAGLVQRRRGGGRPSWLARGTVGRVDVLLLLVVVAGSGSALVLWSLWSDPQMPPFAAALQGRPVLIALAGGLAFSMVNAVAEEFLFRGVLLEGLLGGLRVGIAVGLQAVVFGVAHWGGYPSGWSGLVLSASYGAVLGVLRMRTQGMLAPWSAHVCADLTIAAIALLHLDVVP